MKKTKMKLKKISSLKKDFFSSFLIKFFFRFVFQFCYSLCRFFFVCSKKSFFEAFVMSSVWDLFSIVFKIIKFDHSLSKFFKIVLERNSRSKCCQKCIKFLIENSSLTCVFDMSRVVCNRCKRLNAACMIVKISWICRRSVDD